MLYILQYVTHIHYIMASFFVIESSKRNGGKDSAFGGNTDLPVYVDDFVINSEENWDDGKATTSIIPWFYDRHCYVMELILFKNFNIIR